jgi:hypothetical protein
VLLPSLKQESTCDWNGRRNLPGPFHTALPHSEPFYLLISIILLLSGILVFYWSQTHISPAHSKRINILGRPSKRRQ